MDWAYAFATGSGASGSTPAYREITEPTYAEYRQIYEHDCLPVPFDTLVSVARLTNAPTGVIRALPVPVPPPPSAPVKPSTLQRSSQA